MNTSLWIAQAILALIFIMGTAMKFMPIKKMAVKMPWMGEVPASVVRLLGVIDLFGATGLILPLLLNIQPQLTDWTAICIVVYMLCAIIFHISRGESKVIGFNIFSLAIAAFIAWGRF